MAEYNVQINKYNANNLGYDQLYPQPMKHADTHLLNGSDPINVGELGVSNRNILDNAYWANPDAIIDQRGGYVVPPLTAIYDDTDCTVFYNTVGSYTKIFYVNEKYGEVTWDGTVGAKKYVKRSDMIRGYTSVGYGIDRWYLNLSSSTAGGIQILDDCIQFIANGGTHIIEQNIEGLEDISGKTITLSLLVDTFGLVSVTTALGSIKYKYFNGSNSADGYMSVEQKSSGIVSIVIGSNGTTRKVYAAKLELGTVQTLAHQDENGVWQLNEIPDYGEQLAKCQRYFWRSWTGERNTQNSILGVVFTNNKRITGFDYPVEMRTKPSITVYGLTGSNKVTDWVSDEDYGPASPAYWDTQRCVALACDGAGLSNDNRVYYFIEANAEL